MRLVDETPLVEVEVLHNHADQVLHVSFSHDGNWFATTSKDGFVHVSVYIFVPSIVIK